MADAMMMFLGEAHGVNWYWAQPGEFENPGVYYWDGAKNVLCVPHLAAAPEALAQAKEISPEFTDTARAALLWVLWHHQGGSSDVGQPIRFALGMGQYEKMNAHQVREAKRWAALNPKPTHEAPAQADDTDGPMLDGEGWTITLADGHSGPGWYAHCADCPEEGAVFVAAAPEAPAQNGHLADDERVAALCTLSYAAGMKAGWNYCASEDNEGFERSQKSVGEAIRILKAHRAAPVAQQAAPIDWSQAGRLMGAAMSASHAGFAVGTTNWAAHVYRLMASAQEAPAPQPLTDEQRRAIVAKLSEADYADGDEWDNAMFDAIERAHGITKGEAS